MNTQPHVVVVGGGTAGLTVAARLRHARNKLKSTVVEPSERHFYQPLWTLVGAGVFPKERSMRAEADFMPRGVQWEKTRVVGFEPEHKRVELEDGKVLSYDQLVVAPGIQLDWHKIDGLEPALGTGGVCSIYAYELAEGTWNAINAFDGGDALFTFPSTPVKCAGAPQKIMYLAEDQFRKRGLRDKTRVRWVSASPKLFGIAHYRPALERVVARKGIETLFRHDLIAVRPSSKEAVFRHLDEGREVTLRYDLLHVAPPQSAPDFVKRSPLANQEGWVEVDKHTLQHVRYSDVWSLGDASSLPTSRTGAAIRKQAPVLVENLLAHVDGKPPTAKYDGYTSCPVITGYGSLILAEFDYVGNPAETFPFDQREERYSMYLLKLYVLPNLYWHGMLRGRA